MTQTKMLDGVKLESIFHPSDFSKASELTFVHALKIALLAGAKLSKWAVKPRRLGRGYKALTAVSFVARLTA